MPNYYNRTKGPLPITLLSGKSVVCPPKSWVEIDPEDAGSPSLLAFERSNALVRQKESAPPVEAVTSALPPAVVKEVAVKVTPGPAADTSESRAEPESKPKKK